MFLGLSFVIDHKSSLTVYHAVSLQTSNQPFQAPLNSIKPDYTDLGYLMCYSLHLHDSKLRGSAPGCVLRYRTDIVTNNSLKSSSVTLTSHQFQPFEFY